MLAHIELDIFEAISEKHDCFDWSILVDEVDVLAASQFKINTALILIQVVVVFVDPLFQGLKFVREHVFAYGKSPL